MKKIGFLYIQKSYCVYHSLSIAIELEKYTDCEVHILCTPSNYELIVDILKPYHLKNIIITKLYPYWFFTIPHYFEIKLQLRTTLFYKYSKLFQSIDAFVCTIYEDLHLKKFLKPKKHTDFIFTNHGIPNRPYSFDSRITAFQLFFLLGNEEKKKREELNHLTPTNHTLTGFLKYDLVKNFKVHSFFNNKKFTVLYNPHWEKQLSSFFKFGKGILDFFLTNKNYNLIFAPHALLLERNWKLWLELKKYKNCENILFDFGSEASNNMSYSKSADLYLGDISSQASEFIFFKERPCLFLDAHALHNQSESSFLSWEYGDVLSELNDIEEALNLAVKKHREIYHSKQLAAKERMFYQPQNSSKVAAQAIHNLVLKK